MTELEIYQYQYSKLKALVEQEGYLVVEGPTIELVKMNKVVSSNIESIGYLTANKELFVRFKGSGTYKYENVGTEAVTGLMNAESKGSYFTTFIKNYCKCTKL